MTLGIGLIGTGFMGKAHALAWRTARAVMGDVPEVRLAFLCDRTPEKAAQRASQFGFPRWTTDWRELVADPQVDIVSICTPNGLHRPIAEAALAAGKHVWCEKPLGVTFADAEAMAAAAAASDRKTMVGYSFSRNPAYRHARKLVAEGRIGRILHIRGWVDEDYQADGTLPWTWRCRRSEAGLGALGDVAVHLVSLVTGLAGPIASVQAEIAAAYPTRPLPGGGSAAVENEDIASALVRFEAGFHGVLTASRAAWGRKNRLGFEVHGSEGMIIFDQERMNELELFTTDGAKSEQGFRTILTSGEHPPYASFCPAPGHQIGGNELKVIEAAEFLRAIAGGASCWPDFAAALEIERVIFAIEAAAKAGGRIDVASVHG